MKKIIFFLFRIRSFLSNLKFSFRKNSIFVNESIFQKNLRLLFWGVFNFFDNNLDIDFKTNGEKIFLHNLFKYFKKNCQNHYVFFDIGGNIGEYSQMIIDKSKKTNMNFEIHIFEPMQLCFKILQNKFSSDNIFINKKAISNCKGKTEIFYDKYKSSLASLHKRNLKACSIAMNQSENIEIIRLDKYIKDNNIKHIHFLKIDIEGHELFAFEGFGDYLTSNFIDFIQFEYGGTNLDSHTTLMDFYTMFEKTGFVLSKVMPNGLEIRDYKPYMDNFQYSNYVAISKNIIDKLVL